MAARKPRTTPPAKAPAAKNNPPSKKAGPAEGTLPSAGRGEAGEGSNTEGRPPAHSAAPTAQPEPVVGAPALEKPVAAESGDGADLASETGEVGGEATAAVSPAAAPQQPAPTVPGELRNIFEVRSPVQFDREGYEPGEMIWLTRSLHAELKAAGAVAGDWPESADA